MSALLDDSKKPSIDCRNDTFNISSLDDYVDTVVIKERDSMAVGVFQPYNNEGAVHVTKLRGNFWRTTGHSQFARDYMYLEEALYLVERDMLVIKYEDKTVDYSWFYNAVVQALSLTVYLTYVRLKVHLAHRACFSIGSN